MYILKNFWDSQEKKYKDDFNSKILIKTLRQKHGMFLWNRKGKSFVKWFYSFKEYENYSFDKMLKLIKSMPDTNNIFDYDFIDCVGYIKNYKLRKLVKELKNEIIKQNNKEE
jgi:hypothetical protein